MTDRDEYYEALADEVGEDIASRTRTITDAALLSRMDLADLASAAAIFIIEKDLDRDFVLYLLSISEGNA